jgi:hypothetical protein
MWPGGGSVLGSRHQIPGKIHLALAAVVLRPSRAYTRSCRLSLPRTSLPESTACAPKGLDPGRTIPRSDEFFWRIATAVATTALFALLLVTSLDRRSPLPAGLELVQQEAPSHKVLPQNSGVAAKTIVMQPQATRIDNSVVADKPGRSAAAPAHKTIVNPARHSIYENEADLVAPDTVMHYGRRPSVAP